MKNIELIPSDYKILVVDDIATNTMLLKAVLGRAKYKIITAGGGLEALTKVKQESPDLILLDIMMPDMDGYEVLRQLKNEAEYAAFRDIPVIFLTALHNPEDIVKGFKFGASDYVAKPFNHDELITRVAHHIFIAAAKRTIIKQRDELQASMEARDKMYSVIAHDLRSPIGTLKMIFNMLSMSASAENCGAENFEMFNMGNNIIESTFMLLDNLLKWTKSQTGRMNTVIQEAELSEVVLFASKTQEMVAKVKNIEIEFNISHLVQVQCDVDMIKTIMRNLLSNAIKYSNEGSKVVVSIEENATHAVVHICDSGQGIKEEDIPKLLNPNIHFTTYGTKNEEGSGLGLQLVQDLVHRNGGELTVSSQLGKGSTFTFTIAKQQKSVENPISERAE
ncbi:MAG: hybrid sensor histidine kinase/response regulator [Alistipes sp.]